MKIYIFLALLFLSGCSGEKKAKIQSVSPDGSTELIIEGSKLNFAEPFVTSFMVKGGNPAMAPTTQIFCEDLSPDFVKFKWKAKDKVLVEFLQTDESKRIFQLLIKNKMIVINEVNSDQEEDDDWETGLKVK
jgi:hypothetical protein